MNILNHMSKDEYLIKCCLYGDLQKIKDGYPLITPNNDYVRYLPYTANDIRIQNNLPIIMVCKYGYLSILKYFMKKIGLTKDDLISQDNIAFIYAASNGHLSIIEYIIEEVGLSIEEITIDDNSALKHAQGNNDVIEYIEDIINELS